MSRGLLVCGCVAALMIAVSGSARGEMIFVENHSFEAIELPDGDFLRNGLPGWTILDGRVGAWNPTVDMFPLGVPDGQNTAYSNGGTIAQVLTEPLLPDTEYTLEVAIGHRPDRPFPGYLVQLCAGGVVLAQEGGLAPPPQTFATSIVTYAAAANDARLGQLLEIRLVGLGLQINFDRVLLSRSVVPAPGALALLGAAGLVGRGRRRRR
jgi:hypothetical protein